MKQWVLIIILASAAWGMLAGCTLPASSNPEPTKANAQAVFTAAAQTAESIRLTRAAMTPSPTVEVATPTSLATTPAATISQTITATIALPVATTPAAPAAGAPPQASDRGEFVQDVTVPDGTVFNPNQAFEKKWRLRNSGGTTWTTSYEIVFIDGALMGAPAAVPLPEEVAPGDEVVITVNMVAPAEPGNYRGYWKLRNSNGQIFGMGANADEAIWVDIVVANPALAGIPTATLPPGSAVASVQLNVDNAIGNGCPHTFVFRAEISVNQVAMVTYTMEAGSNLGSQLKTPPPTTRLLEAGQHTVIFELTYSESMSGWARLRISAPNAMVSNQVDFMLSC